MGLVTVIFDFQTGMRLASEMGNLPSKFGHSRPFGSQIIRCVCDEQIEGWTDKSKAYCPIPYGWGHNKATSNKGNAVMLFHLHHSLVSSQAPHRRTRHMYLYLTMNNHNHKQLPSR